MATAASPETEISLLPNDGDVHSLNRKHVTEPEIDDDDVDDDLGEEEGSSSPDCRPFEFDFRYFTTASDVGLADLERLLRERYSTATVGGDDALAVEEDGGQEGSVFESGNASVAAREAGSVGGESGVIVRRWSRRRRNQHRVRPRSSSAFSDVVIGDETLTTRFGLDNDFEAPMTTAFLNTDHPFLLTDENIYKFCITKSPDCKMK